MKKYSLTKVGLLLIGFVMSLHTLAQTFPVQVNSLLTPPNSLFLSDYVAPGSMKWQVQLNFLDFNETSRDVFLRLKIESNELSISTNNDYIPLTPINIIPGIPYLLNGADLYEYLAPQNATYVGAATENLLQNGRLPEGFYSFCVEVIDYTTLEVLSLEKCNSAWLRLMDEPSIASPGCGVILDNSVPQSINFNWQLTNALSIEGGFPEYQLSIYEILDDAVDPATAMINGDVVLHFQSFWQTQSSFVYNTGYPQLENGIAYAYVVQAREPQGRDVFKNNGFSQPCYFYYGYPENGVIPLEHPDNVYGFSKFERQLFQWSIPSNLLEDQAVSYTLKIWEIDSLQTIQESVNNPTWYQYTTPALYLDEGWEHELLKDIKAFDIGQRYSWKVTGTTGNTQIAESPLYEFIGPPLIESFWVNNHLVNIETLTTNDLNDLSGTGSVKIDQAGSLVYPIEFEHLTVEKIGPSHFLTDGIITKELEEELVVELSSPTDLVANGTSVARITEFTLSEEADLRVKAAIEWDFPLVTTAGITEEVKTEESWFVYTNYKMTGTSSMEGIQAYELADPFEFELEISEFSDFLVINNVFTPRLHGKVTFQDEILSKSPGQLARVAFPETNQLFYFMGSHLDGVTNGIKPTADLNMIYMPQVYTFDFSDTQSPGSFLYDPLWRGFYIDEFELRFEVNDDLSNDLHFTTTFSDNVVSDTAENYAYITGAGLTTAIQHTFSSSEGVEFNTFPASLNALNLEVTDNLLETGEVIGDFLIPIISETALFDFTVPISQDGFQVGYLDESLDSTSFPFNSNGGENYMDVSINRAVFENHDHLNMDISITWPALGVTLDGLDNFKVYGNYNVGFNEANGINALTNQVDGVFQGYDITIDFIGAGRDKNLYSFGTSMTMQMGEDVAGPQGAPQVNAFSICENAIIPETYVGTGFFEDVEGQGTPDLSTFEGAAAAMEEEVEASISGAFSSLDLDTETDSLGRLNDSIANLDFDQLPDSESFTLEDLYGVMDFIKLFVENDTLRGKIDTLKMRVQELTESEIVELYEELKTHGFSLQALLKAQVDKVVDKINFKITATMDKINKRIEDIVLEPTGNLMDDFNDGIGKMIDHIGDQVSGIIPSDMEMVHELLDTVLVTTKTNVQKEFKESVLTSVRTNITDQVTRRIDTIITLRVTDFVRHEVTDLGYKIIDQAFDSINFDQIKNNTVHLLDTIKDDVIASFKQISFQGFVNTAENTIRDSYENIKWDAIGDTILAAIQGYLTDEALELVTGAITNLAGEYLGMDLDQNQFLSNIQENVEFDFDNVGEKLKNGEIDEIIKFDPSNVQIKSKVVDLTASLKKFDDDPIYGNGWRADVNANVKKPVSFYVVGTYMNGKIADQLDETTNALVAEGYNYWFFEINVPEGLKIPFIPNAVYMDGIGGKVFHHMTYNNDTEQYIPSDSTKYGAGVNLYVVDMSSYGRSTRMQVTAEMELLQDYFTLEIRGDVGIAYAESGPATNIDVTGPDNSTKPLVQGDGFLGFNSQTKHLLGEFTVFTNMDPTLCAGGSMGIDITDSSWYVYVGKEVDPIYLKLLCKDFATMFAWFEIGNFGLKAGVQQDVSIWARTPWINLTTYKVRPYAGFEYHFLAMLDIQFSPNFKVNEAQLALSVQAAIGSEWENKVSGNTGDWVLAGASLSGLAHYKNTADEAFIHGELAGEIIILNIGLGVDMELHKDLSEDPAS